MIHSLSLALLALTSIAAAHPGAWSHHQAREENKITLAPVVVNDTISNTTSSLTPQSNVTLAYGLNGTNYVNVTITTSTGAVNLETLANLTFVDCSTDSVSLTFADTESLNSAYAEWRGYQALVLVTNNLGDCDTELERGFFQATSFASYETNLTLVATAEKKNITDVASYMSTNFTGLPTSTTALTPTRKRDIILDTGNGTLAAAWDLGNVTLFEYEPYVVATADASVDVSLTVSGYLDFDIWSFSLDALYVDVAATTSADLVLDVDVKAAYNDTFSYSAAVGYYLVDVPGIITIGPDLTLAVGADVSASGAVSVSLDLGADVDDATLHLDLVGDDTAASGWEPTYHANVTISEEVAVGVTPFVAVTVELAFKVLGGLLDLSAGLTPRASFPTTATLSASQEVDVGTGTGGNVTITQPGGDGNCSNGALVESDFLFTLGAFVTEFWSTTLYNVTVPIADECYSWA